MTSLILAIAFSTCNQLMFKLISRPGIDLLGVILVNYAVCTAIGYMAAPQAAVMVPTAPWVPLAIIHGSLLAASFFLMGRTTTTNGVSVAVLSTRLSVVIPTLAAFLLYDDQVTLIKAGGILAALAALYLSAAEKNNPDTQVSGMKNKTCLPLILFLIFGAHTTLLKFAQARFLPAQDHVSFVMAAFFSAFLACGLVICLGQASRHSENRPPREPVRPWLTLASGLALGCVNFGAVFFLLKSLDVIGWQSSQVFPAVSISVVALTALGARTVFGERLGRQLPLVLGLGCAAIAMMNL